MFTRRRPLLDRFQEKYQVNEAGCWVWTATGVANGYGTIDVDGRHALAHRVAYELFVGEIPAGLDLDHLCRNRRCVNPAHLEPVTRSENLRRGFEARGCKNGHPFSDTAFSIVRRADGGTERRCKICHRARNRLAKSRRRKSC